MRNVNCNYKTYFMYQVSDQVTIIQGTESSFKNVFKVSVKRKKQINIEIHSFNKGAYHGKSYEKYKNTLINQKNISRHSRTI